MVINVKDIIRWSIRHWWWFGISVFVCLMLGAVYFVGKTPKFSVDAVLMLRQSDVGSSNQNEMINMMGFGGSKITGDEVMVLTSRDLIGEVVDTLGLTHTYQKKGKLHWKTQYPQHSLSVDLSTPTDAKVTVTVKKNTNGYKIKVQNGLFKKQNIKVSSLCEPIQTIAGEISVSMPDTVAEGTYRAIIKSRMHAIDEYSRALKINRLSRESNIITLSTVTDCPAKAVEMINSLLDLYNLQSATDKNRLALQTELFLASRIEVITQELNEVEAAVEAYKRAHQIADLDKTATDYLQTGNEYERRVAAIEADQRVLDFWKEQLNNSGNAFSIMPVDIGNSNPTLQTQIQKYNDLIAQRNKLLQTATEANPEVVQQTELIIKQRANIFSGLEQAQYTLNLQKQHIVSIQNEYNGRLSSIPETERHYLEMQREKQTKEKQYLYLIEKREENSMLLASDAVPAKIVERAQMNPDPVSPKIKTVGMMSILLGLLLPLGVFLLGLFLKDFDK
ncbi:MAG: Wzz/FepE/Etk N-terminal domain-containing protein [Paludibacteraceae bacterium]|nr:Wzz/FepE/Etk N-terminal domain-containing protein [Paludibacteraceae bacterium]